MLGTGRAVNPRLCQLEIEHGARPVASDTCANHTSGPKVPARFKRIVRHRPCAAGRGTRIARANLQDIPIRRITSRLDRQPDLFVRRPVRQVRDVSRRQPGQRVGIVIRTA